MSLKERKAPYLLMAAIMIAGSISLLISQVSLSSAIAKAEEVNRSAEIAITVITVPECSECFDVEEAVSFIEKQSVVITERTDLSYPSDKAIDLIVKYNISRLPTVIITGEIDNEKVTSFLESNTEQTGDARLWVAITPPYVDAGTGEIEGLVDVIIINDEMCTECVDPAGFINSLSKVGVVQNSVKLLDLQSEEAKAMIKNYSIETLPAVIFSRELSVYEGIVSAWSQFGTVAEDGSFITEIKTPPYVDIASGKVVGIVDVTYLTDSACSECYDVDQHRGVLTNGFGVVIKEEKTVDITSAAGRQLIARYNITQVPTIILSEDAGLLTSLVVAWQNVGSVEEDGTFIFRNLSLMGTYNDLEKNEIVILKNN